MGEIGGSTRLLGVVGNPLAHTLSPAMHNAVYQHLGLDWAYVPFLIPDIVGLRRFMAAIRSMDVVGLSVTMPYKQDVLELCDEVALAARMAGAVNTIHHVDGKLVGYNTDGRGLLESLELEADFTPADKHVVILGSGGAAGAAIVAFILAKAARVTVVGRNLERAEEVVGRMLPHAGSVELAAETFASAGQTVQEAHLIVNATPLGMRQGDESPVPSEWLSAEQVVLDMVYGSVEPTALVTAARAAGAVALDGLGMLVCQGATAIDIWNADTQRRTPRDVMRAAAEKALAARAVNR